MNTNGQHSSNTEQHTSNNEQQSSNTGSHSNNTEQHSNNTEQHSNTTKSKNNQITNTFRNDNVDKTFLSYRGYGLLKSEFNYKIINDIKNELTVSPKSLSSFGTSNVPKFNIYTESSKKLYIPKYYGLQKFGKPDINKILNGTDINLKFNGELRENQLKPVEALLKAARDPIKMGGLINLDCGGGKTCCSLYIISKLKKKTLVIVHKDFLLKQWKERIEQFLPNARVGLIKAKIIDIEDKDIVVGSLQSISMKEYDIGTFDEFGLIIGDEIHNFGAEVFSRALFKTNFKYSLGLSATMTRKDGLSKVFKWHLGDIVYKNNKKKIDNVNVICYEYFVEDPKYSREVLMFNGKPNMARMINNICEYEQRVDKIVNIIKNIKKKEENRNILLLSDRRNHLKEIKRKLDEKNIGNSGYYVGGMKDNELKKSEEDCDILLGTFSMASEGMDIPKLDTIILSSPKSDIIQSVGRILRKKPEDRTYIPLIIDINDMFSMFCNQSKKREKYYNKCKYNITRLKNEKVNTIEDDDNLNIYNQGKCFIKKK